jgi:hypothetical protein
VAPRPRPASWVAKEFADLVPGSSVDGSAVNVWRDGVRRQVNFFKSRFDKEILYWQVFQADEKYLGDKGFGVWIDVMAPPEVRHVPSPGPGPDGYPWPKSGEALDPRLVADLRRYAVPALDFLTDRADLAWILLEEGVVHRGDLHTTLAANAVEGNLVKAMVLAREIPLPEVERAAFDKLDRHPELAEWVRHWAKEFGRFVEADISDLAKKKR